MIGIEAIMDRLKAILTADFPAKIAELNGLYTDFVIPDITGVHVENIDEAILQYPFAIIYEGKPAIEPYSELAAVQYQLSILIWDQCDAEGVEKLHRMLWRYRRAVIEILKEHRQETQWTNLRLTDILPSPVFQSEEEEPSFYMKANQLTYTVQVTEAF